MTKRIIAPRGKTPVTEGLAVGMKQYEVTCKACKEIMGYCWATDSTLKDWREFHFVQWESKKKWHGCLTPHISPVTEQLCLECCCGQDTRDFRANTTLPSRIISKIEKKNIVGRDFGNSDSKFLTKEIKKATISFKEQDTLKRHEQKKTK